MKRFAIRLLTASFVAAAFSVAAPGFETAGLAIPAAHAQQDDQARIPGDLCYWDRVAWSEMNEQEQELWTVLGWDQQRWEGDIPDYSETEDTEWEDLTGEERQAAAQLGYDEGAWNTLTCD
ncbi:MAG: hypothetical protein GVY13_02960 [Alphaproteobacteria bacterium]|jgi:hypothetical protein|nr:hypothetical protein [Alphaproteobacteria bacterium]